MKNVKQENAIVKLCILPSNNFVRLVVFIAGRPRNEAETVFLYKRFRQGHGVTREFIPPFPNDLIYREQFNICIHTPFQFPDF